MTAETLGAPPARIRIRLWDLPLRIFHWSLVAAVAVAIVTGELGGSWMDLHGQAGLAILGLVSFRLTWGLVGSTHARFLSFIPTFARIRAYLRGQWRGVGHNPLGALAVFALLGLLAAQVTTGLFSNDDISFSGPLYALIDEELGARLTGWHRQLSTALFVLLALHVVAIGAYLRFKRDNLVKPMVTGWKDVEAATVQARSTEKGGPLAFIVALGVALAVVWAARGGFA
jgi:cytochrome b